MWSSSYLISSTSALWDNVCHLLNISQVYCLTLFCCLPERKRKPDQTSSAWWWSGRHHSGVFSRWTEPWVSGSTGSSTALAGCGPEITATPTKPSRCKSPTTPCSSVWHLLWWSVTATGLWCPWKGCPEQRCKQSEPPLCPWNTEKRKKCHSWSCILFDIQGKSFRKGFIRFIMNQGSGSNISYEKKQHTYHNQNNPINVSI